MATKAEAVLALLGVQVGEEMTAEKINEVFRNFKEAKKILEDYEKKTLKPFLFNGAEQLGNMTESGGHKVLLPDGTGWEKQARVSVKVDQDKAIEILEEKGLHEYVETDYVISDESQDTVVQILRSIGRHDLISEKKEVLESSLEQAYLNGFLTDDELTSLVSRNVTFALVAISPKEEKKKKKK